MEYDICVVGAGAAGIIFTMEYTRLNPTQKICLVELGDFTENKTNYLDENIINRNKLNHHEPYECTNKVFGGTTATWGGRCVNYDEIDFEEREILKNDCTWDISIKSDLDKYLNITSEYFKCGNDQFNLKEILGKNYKPIAENFIDSEIHSTTVERWSKPTRFGKEYKNAILENENIDLILGLRLEKLESINNRIVNSIFIKNNAESKDIKAKTYVLATGAQEATRILLKNESIFNGNIPDSLGKYYQCHLSGKIASIQFYGKPKETDYFFHKDNDTYVRRRIQFSNELLKKHNLLNTAFWLDNPLYYNPIHKNGAMSFMYLMMITPFLGTKLAPPAIAFSITKGLKFKIFQHILNVVKDLPMSIIKPIEIFYKRYLLERKLPGIFLFNNKNEYSLHFHSEQIPNPKSKLTYDKSKNLLEIHYEIMDEDIDSVIEIHKKLDEHLKASNCGELKYWFPKETLKREIRNMSKDGLHQSGTTRIAKEKEKGVVDYSLKTFDTENLYICSSSVFPTSGQANPTYILGAFAVRLAHHLNGL